MKRAILIKAFLFPVFATAAEFGTKKDVVTSSGGGGGIGIMPFIQMMVALGIVFFILKVILPKFAGKLNKKLITNVNGGIKIEESATFAGGALYVVTARNKTLLLSVSQSGISNLADLTEPNPQPDPPTFMEMLDTEKENPNPTFAVVQGEVEAEGEATVTGEKTNPGLDEPQYSSGRSTHNAQRTTHPETNGLDEAFVPATFVSRLDTAHAHRAATGTPLLLPREEEGPGVEVSRSGGTGSEADPTHNSQRTTQPIPNTQYPAPSSSPLSEDQVQAALERLSRLAN